MEQPLRWTCVVCGADRLDQDIDVMKEEVPVDGTLSIKLTIIHCADNPECIKGAKPLLSARVRGVKDAVKGGLDL